MRVQIVVQDPETGSCTSVENVQISFDLFCAWETKTLSRFVTFPDGSSSSKCRFSMRDSLESVGMSPSDF